MPGKPNIVQQATQYMRMGLRQAAEDLLRQAAKKESRNAEIAHLLGMILVQGGQSDEGIAELERATRLQPRAAELLVSLGNAQTTARRFEHAVATYQRALKLQPGNGPAHLGLALALPRIGDVLGAIDAGREAQRLMPGHFQPAVNLASALKQAGRASEAVDVLNQACERFPDKPDLFSQLLAAGNYTDKFRPEQTVQYARRYGELLGPPEQTRWSQTVDPYRPLRIAYLSADLRTHSVAFFLEPILEAHDRARFEVTCYADSQAEDATTDRLKSHAARWRNVAGSTDGALVELIRSDQIDILVELAGHTTGHRLAAMARRAAPIQATYLGYPGTTGVQAIDYRLVDSMSDPPGSEHAATETLERIPECFLCYRAPAEAPPVSQPPSLSGQTLCFASFNSLPKTTPEVLTVWARVLSQVPHSRLLLKNRSLSDERLAASIVDQLEAHGVSRDRVTCLASAPTQQEHLATYARVDIALDTFPYSGTTTTCEALWMGVPVITCTGQTHASRVSASILSCVGLNDLVADSTDRFVKIAAALAADSKKLGGMRQSLRDRMRSSRLCDAAAFTGALEAAYRRWWQTWCSSAGK